MWEVRTRISVSFTAHRLLRWHLLRTRRAGKLIGKRYGSGRALAKAKEQATKTAVVYFGHLNRGVV